MHYSSILFVKSNSVWLSQFFLDIFTHDASCLCHYKSSLFSLSHQKHMQCNNVHQCLLRHLSPWWSCYYLLFLCFHRPLTLATTMTKDKTCATPNLVLLSITCLAIRNGRINSMFHKH